MFHSDFMAARFSMHQAADFCVTVFKCYLCLLFMWIFVVVVGGGGGDFQYVITLKREIASELQVTKM